MANPQLEDGYTSIANEILEMLARINLSAYESRVLWFVLRKTYGWNKKQDWISSSQFRAGLGGLDRRHIHRAAKSLVQKNMIVICRDDSRKPIYSFQKDYSKWRVSSVEMTSGKKRHLYRHKVSSVEAHTKETLTKREIGSDKPSPKISHLNSRSPQRSPKKENKRPRTLERFTLTDDLRSWCEMNHLPESLAENEVPRFIDWHLAKGKRPKDTKAAFRNWLRKAKEFNNDEKTLFANGQRAGGFVV